MTIKCLNCSINIEQSGNKPKKFCSDKCRMAYNYSTIEDSTIGNDDRDSTIENEKKPFKYVIENKEKKEKKIRETFPDWKGYGWCKYCGDKMEFDEGECCYSCVKKK